MKVKFSRCTSSNLTNVPQIDGQLIYTKDTDEVYLDIGTQRKKVSDIIVVNTLSNIINPLTTKVYLVKETEELYSYLGENEDGEKQWKSLTGVSKKYVDDSIASIVPLRDFPEEVNTTGTTEEFIASISALHVPVGSMYLGVVQLTDFPNETLKRAELRVEVYPSNVIYLKLSSADVYPYNWECNSYDYEGWQPVLSSVNALTDSKAYTDTKVVEINQNIDTKIGEINQVLDDINGEEV